MFIGRKRGDVVMKKFLSFLVIIMVSITVFNCSGGGGGGSQNSELMSQDISLKGPFIMHISSEINGTKIENLLIPQYMVFVDTYGLKSDNIKIKVTTTNSSKLIAPTKVSVKEQSIEFLAPISSASGELSIVEGDKVLASETYKIYDKRKLYITSIMPQVTKIGETVTIYGEGLTSTMQVLSHDSDLNITVTASNNEVHFTLPSNARSGKIYLNNASAESNGLYLSVKRTVDVNVSTPVDSNFTASSIAFVLAGKEYRLSDNFTVSLPVENSLSYIDATVEMDDGVFSHLYSAVVLPDMNDTIHVDAKSTAVSLIFIGLGASKMNKEDWRTLYNTVVNNTKVQLLADYIASLQKNDFLAWSALSDSVLKSTYQDALRDILGVLEQKNDTHLSSFTASTNPVVQISQNPESKDIYVNDISYGYLSNSRLNNGSVTVVNDTQLYLSVEVIPKDSDECILAIENDEGCVLNHYRHIRTPFEMKNSSIVKPKTGMLGISVAQTFRLDGKDANLEILTGGVQGDTDKENIADILKMYSFVDGVLAPSLGMVLSPLIGKILPEEHKYKNILDGLSLIYGTNSLVTLTKVASNESATWSQAIKTVLIKPVTDGLKSCISIKPGALCYSTMHGVAKLYGIDSEGIYEELQKKFIEAAYDRIAKRVIVSIPFAGWAIESAIVVYEAYDTISTVKTIGGTLKDIKSTPKELNVDVNFTLAVNSVTPICIGISPSTDEVSLYIKGDGFLIDDKRPNVFISNEGGLIRDASSLDTVTDTKIYATFKAQPLIDNRSVAGHLFVDYGDYFAMNDENLRIIDEGDEIVYFDSIEPEKAVIGKTITLHGCGWLPLDDIKVFFQTENGEVEGELLSKSAETIEVKVPEMAIDGFVYVTAGNKRTTNIYLEIADYGLTEVEENLIQEHEEIVIDGKGLDTVNSVVFVDSAGIERNTTITMQSSSPTFIIAVTPDTLAIGLVGVYAVREDGLESNMLTLKRIPKGVVASPSDTSFRSTLLISLSQAEGEAIFYRINGGEESLYTESFELNASQITHGDIELDVYARTVVDDISYESKHNSYRYIIDTSNLTKCPLMYDASLDIHPENPLWLVIGVTRDSNGDYEKYTSCDYYESEVLRYDCSYINYNHLEGITTSYYETGRVNYLRERYSDGVLDGSSTHYYDNEEHVINMITPIKHGRMNGMQQEFYDTGIRKAEVMYSDGRKLGVSKQFFENGKIYTLKTYDDYKLDGLYQIYYKTDLSIDQLKYTGTYVKDKKEGDFKTFNLEGEMIACETYSEDTHTGSCMPPPD